MKENEFILIKVNIQFFFNHKTKLKKKHVFIYLLEKKKKQTIPLISARNEGANYNDLDFFQ